VVAIGVLIRHPNFQNTPWGRAYAEMALGPMLQ